MGQKGTPVPIGQIVVWVLLTICLILILRAKIKGIILFLAQRRSKSKKKDDEAPPLAE
jgi:hypothetical protein